MCPRPDSGFFRVGGSQLLPSIQYQSAVHCSLGPVPCATVATATHDAYEAPPPPPTGTHKQPCSVPHFHAKGNESWNMASLSLASDGSSSAPVPRKRTLPSSLHHATTNETRTATCTNASLDTTPPDNAHELPSPAKQNRSPKVWGCNQVRLQCPHQAPRACQNTAFIANRPNSIWHLELPLAFRSWRFGTTRPSPNQKHDANITSIPALAMAMDHSPNPFGGCQGKAKAIPRQPLKPFRPCT